MLIAKKTTAVIYDSRTAGQARATTRAAAGRFGARNGGRGVKTSNLPKLRYAVVIQLRKNNGGPLHN